MLFEKMRKTYRLKKSSAIAMALVVMMSMLTMGAIIDNDTKKVTFVQRDSFQGTENTREIITRKATVEEFLEEQGIVLAVDEVLNAELTDAIVLGKNITVAKSRLVEVHADGGIKFERATETTVGEALKALGYEIAENDIITPDTETLIEEGMSIILDRVEIIEEVNEILIPYEAIRESDTSKYVNEKTVKQYGVPGKQQETVRIVKKNGVEVSREILSTVTVSEPQNEIVVWGTKQKAEVTAKKQSVASGNSSFKKAGGEVSAAVASNNSKGFSYSKVIEVTATAYDPSPSSNAGYSKTAYGLTPQYGVVAVDPSVIPLGTRLYIESSDGGASWVYGYCIAGDTGGAIKGNKVDLCFNTKAECRAFGRKSATVYILN